jgi:tetratricopeptide (TPR) repeat protein
MALALAGGAVLGTAVTGAPAFAQEQPDYSKGFVAAYAPVAEIANAEAGDFAGAKSQLDAVYAAVENEDDRNAAGNLTLILGNKLKDTALQRRGLEMMLQSGKVPAEQVGQFQFFVGNLAYSAQDWAAARTALQAAVAAGYTQDDPEGLIAETYFSEGQAAQGLDYLKGVVEQRLAAGQPVPENWLLRGLRMAYEGKLPEQASDYSALLVRSSPTERNWLQALQVVNAVNSFEPQVQLDLLRLMLATNSLTERREFANYIEAADVRVMSNEVLRVLERGVQAGVFNASDDYYSEVKRLADERAPIDRQEAPGLAAEASSAANGTAAMSAGDVFMSLADYAQAETMFQLALEKGGVDRDRALTRLGIAQAQQGKNDAAKSSFAEVSGARAPVARMWTAYVETKA